MKKIVRLTERDLTRIVKRVLEEQSTMSDCETKLKTALGNDFEKVKKACVPNPLNTECGNVVKELPPAAKKAVKDYQLCKVVAH